MQGTFNTSDFDEEEEEEKDEEEEEDGFGEDTGDGFGDDVEDPLNEEDEDEYDMSDEPPQNNSNSQEEKERFKLGKSSIQYKGNVKRKKKVGYRVALGKKYALSVECSPMVAGICPVCRRKSIFRSLRPFDLLLTALIFVCSFCSIKLTTFYCLNPQCKRSYYNSFGWRCAGDAWIGKKICVKQLLAFGRHKPKNSN